MPPYDYEDVRRSAERVPWDLEDVLSDGDELDFTRPFLPFRLVSESRPETWDTTALLLNQIRGYGYVRMLALAEAVILPFILDHARSRLRFDPPRLRALLGFAALGAKHLALFRRLGAAFDRGFGTSCEIVGPEDGLAREVLRHPPLTIALSVLHMEAAAAAHESAARDEDLEPRFARLFSHHHADASLHAKLIANVVHELAAGSGAREREDAVHRYLKVVDYLDGAFTRQVDLDLVSLRRAGGDVADPDVSAVLRDAQLRSQRRCYLGLGMTSDLLTRPVEALGPDLAERVRAASRTYL